MKLLKLLVAAIMVIGVRAQIRQAYGLPSGCGASHRCEIGV